jgi:hypothetical protein
LSSEYVVGVGAAGADVAWPVLMPPEKIRSSNAIKKADFMTGFSDGL